MTHWNSMAGIISDTEINRMRWASRRGMLELDLVLKPFVEARYAELDDRDRERFQQLMLCEDQDLFTWFMRREIPQDQELQAIVSTVLKFALTEPGNR
jgi:antitoxin CptB